MKTILIGLLLLLAAAGRAEDFIHNGRTYRDIALITNRCDPAGIVFSHRAGVARVAFSEMTEADRLRFGFDPARFEAFRAEQQAARAATPPPASAYEAPPAPPPPNPTVFRTTTVVLTNAAPPAFNFNPAQTIEPDYQKLHETRLEAIRKAMEINRARRKR